MTRTMTCEQLGGPCGLAHRGTSADDVIKSQERHLKDAVAGGDVTHAPALDDMVGRRRRPWTGMSWYRATKRAFAALPDD
jgi:hypothetical protein